MAEFNTKCPHCSTELQAQEEWIGMEVECPVCQKNFTVQSQASAPMPAELGNSRTFTFVCPSCDAVAELPASLLGRKYECRMCFEEHIAQATTERQCPVCGRTIKYHAAVCKFCKADLTKAPPPSAPKPEETFVFICPECDMVEILPVSMKGKQYECKTCCETSVAEPAEERKCPYCGEKIKIKASICKYCKKDIPPVFDSKKRFDTTGIQSLKSKLSTILSFNSLNSMIWKKTTKNQCPENGFWDRIKYLFFNLNKACQYIIIVLVLLVIIGISCILLPKGCSLTSSLSTSSSSSSSARSYSPANSRISVSVTVKKWNYHYDSSWKYNCEYKLYANDQLVASRNSTRMSVTFNVKVERGASLRAEMLPKNAYGGIAETLEGPNWNKTVTANYSGETLTIECGY